MQSLSVLLIFLFTFMVTQLNAASVWRAKRHKHDEVTLSCDAQCDNPTLIYWILPPLDFEGQDRCFGSILDDDLGVSDNIHLQTELDIGGRVTCIAMRSVRPDSRPQMIWLAARQNPSQINPERDQKRQFPKIVFDKDQGVIQWSYTNMPRDATMTIWGNGLKMLELSNLKPTDVGQLMLSAAQSQIPPHYFFAEITWPFGRSLAYPAPE